MTKKIAIWGSCVTRDIFRLFPTHSPLLYIARTSFISTMNPAMVPIDDDSLKQITDFNQAYFKADNEGLNLERLVEFNPTVIVFDFIDERYDLIEIDNKYILLTNEISAAQLVLGNHKILERNTYECYKLWNKSMRKFVKVLTYLLPHTIFLLHDASWAKYEIAGIDISEIETVKESELLVQISPSGLISVAEYDALTRLMLNAFHNELPSASIINADYDLHISSLSHTWGKAPFHYVDSYYKNIKDKLILIGCP